MVYYFILYTYIVHYWLQLCCYFLSIYHSEKIHTGLQELKWQEFPVNQKLICLQRNMARYAFSSNPAQILFLCTLHMISCTQIKLKVYGYFAKLYSSVGVIWIAFAMFSLCDVGPDPSSECTFSVPSLNTHPRPLVVLFITWPIYELNNCQRIC